MPANRCRCWPRHRDSDGGAHPPADPFQTALEALADIGEPINRVLEIELDGEHAIVTLYDPARE